MLQLEPSARLALTDVIGHFWMRGEYYDDNQFMQLTQEIMQVMRDE